MSKRSKSKISLTIAANDATARAFGSVNRNFDKFERRLSTSEASMRGYGGVVSSVSDGIGKMAGLIGGVSLVAMGAQAASSAKEVIAYADSLNVSVESLSAWQFAAKGTTLQGGKIADMFKDISERIGETAEMGTGEGVKALKHLGLSAKELVSIPVDEQILRIAKALGNIKSEAGRGSIMEQLVSDGTLLLPLLDDNAAKFRELEAVAISTGAVLTSLEAGQINEITESIDEMSGALDGVSQQALIAFGPSIISGAEALGSALSFASKNTDALKSSVVAGAVAYAAYKISKSGVISATGGLVAALKSEYAQRLTSITTIREASIWTANGAAQTRAATIADKAAAAQTIALTRSKKMLGGAIGLLTGPVGLAALTASLAFVALRSDAVDEKTRGLLGTFVTLSGAVDDLKISKLSADIFEYERAISKMEDSGVPGIFGNAAQYNLDLMRLRGNLTKLRIQLKEAGSEGKKDDDPGGPVTSKIDHEIERSRGKMKAWAADYARALDSTRTPQERYIANLEKAQNIFNVSGNADLFERQVSALNDSRLAGIDQLSASLMTEEQKIGESYARRAGIVESAFNDEIINKERRDSMLLSLGAQFDESLYQQEQQAKTAEHVLWETSWQGKAQVASNIMGSLSVLMQSENRKAFEVGKAAAISQAVIDTISGAQAAFTAMAGIKVVGPALGIAAAGAAILAGTMRVNQIKSTKFGGGSTAGIGSAGAAPAASYGGASAGAGVIQQNTPPQESTARVTNYYISGNLVDLTQLSEELRPYNDDLESRAI